MQDTSLVECRNSPHTQAGVSIEGMVSDSPPDPLRKEHEKFLCSPDSKWLSAKTKKMIGLFTCSSKK